MGYRKKWGMFYACLYYLVSNTHDVKSNGKGTAKQSEYWKGVSSIRPRFRILILQLGQLINGSKIQQKFYKLLWRECTVHYKTKTTQYKIAFWKLFWEGCLYSNVCSLNVSIINVWIMCVAWLTSNWTQCHQKYLTDQHN